MRQPELRTERLWLRPFNWRDGHAVYRLAGDPLVAATTLNVPHPYTRRMALRWIRSLAPKRRTGTALVYAITLRSQSERVEGIGLSFGRRHNRSELVGCIGLSIDQRHNRSELGYWIGVDYWNKGYCTEAARGMLNLAFGGLKMRRVYASHLQSNSASGRVMSKLGMNYEGCFPQHVRKAGRYFDLVQYGIVNPVPVA